jgi:hypothetical protein
LATLADKRVVQIIPCRISPEDNGPTHTMKRESIEKGISDAGFQFYRMKKSESCC